MRILLPIFVAAALALGGCAVQDGDAPVNIPAAADTGTDYRIGPDDTLEISFADEPTMTQQVKVTHDGLIHLSYLAASGKDAVRASNRSPSEIAADINRLAAENGLLKYPLCHVRIVEYAGRSFSLYGEVRNPGRYVFSPAYLTRMDFLEAVAMGGGLTEYASYTRILVKRDGHLYRLNLRKMLMRSGDSRFDIYPGDVITVTRSFF